MWVAIKAIDCDLISVANMLWLHPKDRAHLSNPITKQSLTIWDKFKVTPTLQSSHNPLLSFLRNPAFYPSWESPTAIAAWFNANLFRLHTHNAIHTLPILWETFGLPRTELFRYLQENNFYMPFLQMDSPLNQITQFERICKRDHTLGD